MEVCMKCSRRCLLRKKCSESPQISSFFKVMFGNKFSERLFLPPKFVRTHKLDVGRKMILKDSSSKRWNIGLSSIDGGLAFEEGWNRFLISHGIELGDFVVFHYVVESSQFTVQLFGKSGCEKFSVENNKKSKTSGEASTLHVGYDPFCKPQPEKHPSDDCSLSEQSDYMFKRRDENEDVRMSSPVQECDPHENIVQGLARETAWDFMDDVSFMLDRNMDFSKRDVNEDTLDLSMFELPEKKTVAKEVFEMEGGPSFDAKQCHFDEEYIFSNNVGLMTENKETYPLAKEYTTVPENSPNNEIAPSFSMAHRPVVESLKSEFLAPSGTSVPEIEEAVDMLEDPFLMLLEEHGTHSGTQTPTPTPTPTPCPMLTSHSNQKAGRPRGRPRVVKREPRVVKREQNIVMQEPKSLESKILAPSVGPLDSLDHEPFPSAPELGEVVPALEDPSLSVLKVHGTRSRTRTQTLIPCHCLACPMPTTQSSKKAGRPTERPRERLRVKQEPKAVNQERRIIVEPEVLIEEHEPIAIIPATVASITCSVQADKDYFLLPEPLPVNSVRRVKREKKVIYLSDPVGRTWPVLYHQNYGSNVLASGWDVFRKANDIQKGNTCTFSLPDVDEPVIAVTIHPLLYLS